MMLTLVLSLAYWWLDNLAHELFGTALFVLLIWHLVVNRRWFINLRHGSYDVIRVATVGLHFALILNMILLFANKRRHLEVCFRKSSTSRQYLPTGCPFGSQLTGSW